MRSCRSTHFKAVQVVLCSMRYVPVHTGTKYVAFMYMHLLNKISKLGNMANFDHFAKAIERQNGQKLAEFEGERQKGQKRICPKILMMTKGKAHQAVKGIFIYF